ncbi:unnamed protein product [Cylindrotheca closterium]|uniref:Uncharacterized protein n=1 Tax=Cylindrotheca closterium TaxID=2856 RepID=A0AAD2G7T3_9STRA|nr:unnamed protein product [Cylindrotheca closterium]
MVQSCPFFAPFLGIPYDSCGAIKSVSDDKEDKAIRKVSSARAPSPMDLQDAFEDKHFQHYADKFERSPKHTYCNNPTLGDLLLQGKCCLFHQPSAGWQMPQFDFPLWMFKCWHHSHGQLGTTPLICSLTMPRYKLQAVGSSIFGAGGQRTNGENMTQMARPTVTWADRVRGFAGGIARPESLGPVHEKLVNW